MPKCRPGDLAVVVQAELRHNLGKIVRVVAADDGKGDLAFSKKDGVVWHVASASIMHWRRRGKTYRRRAGPVPDSKLQPIRGLSECQHDVESREACPIE